MTDSLFSIIQSWVVYPPKTPPKKIQKIDLNKVDSLELSQLVYNNLKLASRIIKYREKLGGFIQIEQLKEVYGLSNKQYERIVKSVYIPKNFHPKSIDLTTADFKTLISHPYISFKMAKLLLNYREHCDLKCDFEDFKQLKDMDTIENQLIKFYIN